VQIPGVDRPVDQYGRRVDVPWTIRDVILGSALVVAAVFAFFVVLSFVAGSSEAGKDWFENGDVLGLPAALALAIVLETFFLASVYAFAISKYGASIPRLGFIKPAGRRPYLLALGAWLVGLAALLTWAGLTEVIGIDRLKIPDPPEELVDYSGVRLAFPLLIVGLFGPFCEEVFFRGFALPAFASRFGLRGGILVSALLFAAFHFSIGAFVPIFIFGIVLAWLYVRTGSIYPSMVAHATQNIIATLAST